MKKILVVDDRKTNRVLLSRMLETISKDEKYETIEADGGEAAVELFCNEKPDLILLDYNMPNKTGCQTAKEIKLLDRDNYTPIIFVTAMTADSALENALSAGGDDYIEKPFDVCVLKSKIQAHLRIKDLNNKLKEKNSYLTREQELLERFFENALNKSYLDDNYIKYHTSALAAFNGDVFLSKKGPSGGLYVLVGDFTGHGLSAAMGTLPVAMIFLKMTEKGLPIEKIARELNNQLHLLMPTAMFFAASLIYLGRDGKSVSIWMGGMPDCYWVGQESGIVNKVISSQHMPLGILDDSEFEEKCEHYEVDLGDKIYLVTDGITEAMNNSGKSMFKSQVETILSSKNTNMIQHILTALQRFVGDAELKDDITMVELTCNPIEGDDRRN